jgi:pimeloyl-ACP methyl ester carboxylesterase
MNIELLSRVPSKVEHRTPVLFVHGAWHGAWCWEKYFMPYFAEKGYPAYALSFRGHGKSGGAKGLRHYRVKDYVMDLRKIIDKLPCPPILVAHSLGGQVVQKYLECNSAPAAVLMAPVPVGGIVKMLQRLVRTHPFLFLKVNIFLSLLPYIETRKMAKEMLFSEAVAPDELKEYYGKLQDESYLSFLDMLFLAPIRPQRVTSQVLVLGAANDRVFYRRDIRKTARAYNHRAVIMADMPHDMMLDRDWKRAADVILGWLAERNL